MKKLAIILGIVCAFAVCLVSCKEEETTGKIQGFVTNYLTNEPIQGVNISLSPTGASAVTGSDGRYEFANLQPGNYTVQGMKQGFESNTKNITIAAGYISSGDMQLRPAATGFRLNVEYLDFGSAFSDLSFKIINVSSNTPMSWEIVESLNWLTATPSTGNLQGGQETTVNVSIDRSLLTQSTTAYITVRSADQTIVLPINVTMGGNNGPQLQLSETSLDFGTSEGVISVASNVIPREMGDMVRSALAGDFAKARELHAKYYSLFRDLFIDVNPVMVKEALWLMGRLERVFRLPLCETTERNLETIKVNALRVIY